MLRICLTCGTNNQYLKEVLRQQYLIKNMVADLKLEIQTIQQGQVTENVQNRSLFLEEFKFPLEGEDELETVNQYLSDSENFTNAINGLSPIGGNITYEFTKRTMSIMISDVLANKYSWVGRRSKQGFYNLHIAKLLIEAEIKHGKAKDQKESETNIAAWLRRAQDRLNAEKSYD